MLKPAWEWAIAFLPHDTQDTRIKLVRQIREELLGEVIELTRKSGHLSDEELARRMDLFAKQLL